MDAYTEGLWARAVSFAGCAQALAVSAESAAKENGVAEVERAVFNGDHSASIHLLSGFSLELMLKVGFLLRGGDRKKLMAAIKHDLRKALAHAERQGFKPAHPKTRAVVEAMRQTHLNHHFRYGDLPMVTLPALHETFGVLNALYSQLGAEIYPDAPSAFRSASGPS